MRLRINGKTLDVRTGRDFMHLQTGQLHLLKEVEPDRRPTRDQIHGRTRLPRKDDRNE